MTRSYRQIYLSDLFDLLPDAPSDLVTAAAVKAEHLLQARWGGRVTLRVSWSGIEVHDCTRTRPSYIGADPTWVGSYSLREHGGEIIVVWEDADGMVMHAGPADVDGLAHALADLELGDADA